MTTGRLWALSALLAALCVAAAGKGSPEQDREWHRRAVQAAGGRQAGGGAQGPHEELGCLPPRDPSDPADPRHPPALPPPPTGDILFRFRDSIPNWAAVKAEGHLQGWDDATPTYLWSGVILDFHQRVRVM